MEKHTCPFCNSQDKILFDTQNVFVISDKYPITKNHTLIIPKRHVESFFDLSSDEYAECLLSISISKQILCDLDNTISAFNIGINDGTDAGQTISHCHIHLIPRRKGDIQDPSGGVRNIFPEKGFYQ
jgi:diadenosine tetraphosphate (Ap4A) HIT family hydrolase